MKIIGSDLMMVVADVPKGHVFRKDDSFYLKLETVSLDLVTGATIAFIDKGLVHDLGPIKPIRHFKDLRVGDTAGNYIKTGPNSAMNLITLAETDNWVGDSITSGPSSLNLDTMNLVQ